MYPVHRLVLSACSPYFDEVFQATRGKHPVIVLKDVSSRMFDCILSFLYNGEVRLEKSELNEFLTLANSLKIKGLNTVPCDNINESLESNVPNMLSSTGSDVNDISNSSLKRKNEFDTYFNDAQTHPSKKSSNKSDLEDTSKIDSHPLVCLIFTRWNF